MPLLDFWKASPSAVGELGVDQIVATAGDGNLRDHSTCSSELRQYFAQIPSEKLATYVSQCLTTKFDKNGQVLQDLINELGRRLDYKVTNGLYQGVVGKTGQDGLWEAPEGVSIVTEVKTTDAYRISLDTLSTYRQKLMESGAIKASSSILMVVGRQDTGELEAQVRGSRHAWDIRLISAESLIKLVALKENSGDLETARKIRSVLAPVEYTRLDRLVDVMFTTAKDVAPTPAETDMGDTDAADDAVGPKSTEPRAMTATEPSGSGVWVFTDAVLLQRKRDAIIAALSLHLGAPLIRKTRTLFWSADHSKRVACTISKRYVKRASYPYWFAFHPQWDEFLGEAAEGFLSLGCMDLDVTFLIPDKVIHDLLSDLNTTETDRGEYWHLHIVQVKESRFELLVPRKQNLDLSPFALTL